MLLLASLKNVVLPHPFGPTKIIRLPIPKLIFKPEYIGLEFTLYPKHTSLNSIIFLVDNSTTLSNVIFTVYGFGGLGIPSFLINSSTSFLGVDFFLNSSTRLVNLR